jgi:hypothetical protein
MNKLSPSESQRIYQHFGMYDRLDDVAWYVFETAPFELDSEGRTK